MNCLKCGAKNPMTVSYCQACGARMDLTADEIQASFIEKKRGERIESGEKQGEHMLLFGAAVLLVAITAFMISGGAPDDAYWIPSAANGSKYVEVDYQPRIEMKALKVPLKLKADSLKEPEKKK